MFKDWSYLSSDARGFSETHARIGAITFFVLTPIFANLTVACIFFGRFATRRKSELVVYKVSYNGFANVTGTH